jgi:hypothetical protein
MLVWIFTNADRLCVLEKLHDHRDSMAGPAKKMQQNNENNDDDPPLKTLRGLRDQLQKELVLFAY